MAGGSRMAAILQDGDRLLAEVEALVGRAGQARAEIGRVIYGQRAVVDETLITLLAGGHVLLVGVPGLGKTLLVETRGACSSRPISCRPTSPAARCSTRMPIAAGASASCAARSSASSSWRTRSTAPARARNPRC